MKIVKMRANHVETPLGYELSDLTLSWKVEEAEGKKTRSAQVRIYAVSYTHLDVYKRQAPNPARNSIRGVICGVRVETIEEPLMREIRYLDKLVDELAKGKAMDKILRK